MQNNSSVVKHTVSVTEEPDVGNPQVWFCEGRGLSYKIRRKPHAYSTFEAFGYNRDGKKGKRQMVIGLLCDKDGVFINRIILFLHYFPMK